MSYFMRLNLFPWYLSVHYIIPPHSPPVVGLLRHPSSSPPEPEAAYGVR